VRTGAGPIFFGLAFGVAGIAVLIMIGGGGEWVGVATGAAILGGIGFLADISHRSRR